jgi:Predicted membrane protein (DUF2142)
MPHPAAFLSIGMILLVVAWIAATPPGSAPDEDAHYVKALGAGGGQLRGAPVGGAAATKPPAGRAQIAGAWLAENTRSFVVPANLLPRFGCFDLFVDPSAEVPASCSSTDGGLPASPLVAARLIKGSDDAREQTYVGTYPPFVYVVPGISMRLGADDSYTAFRIGRGVSAAICLALLLLAVAVLWEPRSSGMALIGLTVAVTPGALFIVSTLTPSGPEVASGICFIASLLRLAREPRAPRWVWLACAVSGSMLTISRPLGVFFVPFAICGVALLMGTGPLVRAWRAGRRAAGATAGALLLTSAVAIYWQVSYQPDPSWHLADLADALGPSLTNLPEVMREQVGMFAAFFPAPAYLYVPCGVLVAGLLLLALLVADGRRRWGLALVSVAAVVLTICLSVLHRTTGFDQFSGRYILPVFVLVPLGAAEVLRARRDRLSLVPLSSVVIGFAVAGGLLQGAAWWAAARRSAVGTDGPLLFSSSDFEPPGGWVPWMLVVVLAVLAYVAAGVSGARARGASRPRP